LTNAAQEGTPRNSEIPIADKTTNSDQEHSARPNKYKYPEFDGLAGEDYLLSLAQQFSPFALWRTWYAAVSWQAAGNTCYVGVSQLVNRKRQQRGGIGVGVKERKIYLDLQALEARGWLRMQRVRKPFVQDGSITYYVATDKDFTGFYDTAHDYHLWLHSPDYIEPERENVPLILADAELCKRLVKFENYRRLLLCGKPGRKSQKHQDFYTCQLAQLEEVRTFVPIVNHYSNGSANSDSLYRVEQTGSNNEDSTSSFSTAEKGTPACPTAIRSTQAVLQSEQDTQTEQVPQQPSKPKPSASSSSSNSGETAKRVLGYTEEELKQDIHKRGAAFVGIPADQYAKLTGSPDLAERVEEQRSYRPEREIPAQVEEEVSTYARQYDDSNLIQSDVTRARKIYATAEQALRHDFDATLFWSYYDKARSAAAKYARKRRNSKGGVTRVPYMFKCLENAFGFSLEELVYLRTEDPLYTDKAMWDVIDYLRVTYQEQYYRRETSLDYRQWLQGELDRLERCEQPKQRNNRTMRDY